MGKAVRLEIQAVNLLTFYLNFLYLSFMSVDLLLLFERDETHAQF